MSDLREPMRIKGILTFFQKYTKTPSNRIEKKGSLLLTIYFPDYSIQWIFTIPCWYEENALQCFTPDIFLNHPFLEDE